MTQRIQDLTEAFQRRFQTAPATIVSAPGRVNLIGEHTDYTGGYVFPAAIDREMIIAGRANGSDEVFVHSLDYAHDDSFSVKAVEKTPHAHLMWSNYLRAVVKTLLNEGHKIGGFTAVLSGNVPQGAGLSSSAAYEVAAATLLDKLFDLSIAPRDIALLCQKAENQFVGVQCGIMDQFISALAEPDSALLIDCRSLDYRAVKLNLDKQNLSLVIVNSGVKRGLVESEYNARRSECEAGTKLISDLLEGDATGKIDCLGDVSLEEFRRCEANLPEQIARRCRHVIGENKRVLDAVDALERQDMKRFGRLMNESHFSLRDDFQVSCPEVDLLVSLLQEHKSILGSRMTGAGFGGCTVSLVETRAVDRLQEEVLARYDEQTGRHCRMHICRAVQGAVLV